MKKILLVVLVLLMSAFIMNAQIVDENFNYTDGSLLTANGWTAHSGTGTQSITVTSGGGLSYTGYVNSGVGNAALVDNNGEDVSKTFTAVTSGTLYYSCLVNVTNAVSGYFLHLGGSATAFAARVFVQPSATIGKINFYLSNRSTDAAPTSVTDFDPSTTYLIIVKYDVSTTGTGSLWVKASGVPGDEISAGTPIDTTVNSGQASIDRICLRQYNASQNYTVDGIRVSTSWDLVALPVELTSFTGIAKGRGVELAWQTATEINNHGFEIERRAAASGTWNKIGFVTGNGNSNSPKSYSYTDATAKGNVIYRLKQIDNDGQFEYHGAVEVNVSTAATFALAQNYPNPFNPATQINYVLPASGFVSLKVYDMLGKEIATLVNGMQEAGEQQATFTASNYPSGMYFYTLRTGSFVETKKMLLVK